MRVLAGDGAGDLSPREAATGQPNPLVVTSPSPRVRVVVEDTGVGIAPEFLPKLFRMFHQGEADGQRTPGLGIGLSLARSLVELHGGDIRAASGGIGKGSRFVVELPRIATPALQLQAPPSTLATHRYRLLLVEDNPDTRALLQEGLAMRNYEVRAAANAEDALTLLQGTADKPPDAEPGAAHQSRVALRVAPTVAPWQPDAILSDIGLPGMDGCAFLRRARALPAMEGVVAIALSGYGREEDLQRSREAGFDEHLIKPVDVVALDACLRKHLAERAHVPAASHLAA